MEKPRRPRGRPPGPAQTLPLFLHIVRTRVKTSLIISTFTDHELRCYVPWAARRVMMDPEEILVRVVDRALDEYFKRDKLWRKDREAILREAELSRWRSFGLRSTASDSNADAPARVSVPASDELSTSSGPSQVASLSGPRRSSSEPGEPSP
jgi:hypothetical protein